MCSMFGVRLVVVMLNTGWIICHIYFFALLFFVHCTGQNLELVSHVYILTVFPICKCNIYFGLFFFFFVSFDYLNIFLSHMKDDDNSCTQGQHRIRTVSNSLICTANRELNDVSLIGINFCFLIENFVYQCTITATLVRDFLCFYGTKKKKLFRKKSWKPIKIKKRAKNR